jgi:hypothetical protein
MDSVPQLAAPLLAHLGTNDAIIPRQHVGELMQHLAKASKQAETTNTPDAPHAFDEDFSSNFRPVAAFEAWRRTGLFLRWHLNRDAVEHECHEKDGATSLRLTKNRINPSYLDQARPSNLSDVKFLPCAGALRAS